MDTRKPTPITLAERQPAALTKIERREKSTQQQIRRTSVILLAAKQASNCEIANRLNLTLQTVRRWRRRWLEVSPAMRTAEDNGDDKQSEQSVFLALCDEARSGKPADVSPEQICQIVAIACEKTEDSQRPISHWTGRELADEPSSATLYLRYRPAVQDAF